MKTSYVEIYKHLDTPALIIEYILYRKHFVLEVQRFIYICIVSRIHCLYSERTLYIAML